MKNVILFTVLAALGLPAAAQDEASDPESENRPAAIVPENTPSDILRPPADRQVAVLSIALDYEGGELRSARLLSSDRINSYAPKVFLRRGGDWEVIINGAEDRRFFVSDPGFQEAYPGREGDDELEYVRRGDSITWSLVVPLYADGRPLNARSITIIDVETGEVILEAEI